MLDLNELAAVHGEQLSLGQLQLSRCGARAAFSLEAGDGSESYAAFLRELAPEDDAGARRGGVARRQGLTAAAPAYRHLPALDGLVSLEWAADGVTLLFTTPNALGRPWAVHAWNAGPPLPRGSASAGAGGRPAVDTLFEEPDERFFVDIGRTKDWTLLTINCNSKTSSEASGRRWLEAGAAVRTRAPG